MFREREVRVERRTIARRVLETRESAGLSRAELARIGGLTKRRLDSIEHGRVSASESELRAVAAACEVDVGALIPLGYQFTLAASATTTSSSQLQGDAALDALLREYVSMVLDLRSLAPEQLTSIRQDDLTELARALGGTPEAIETRLTQLLGTTDGSAAALRASILPSSNPAHANGH
jgi:transcriptional regulator with XRE-family HTH domain